MAPCRQLLMWSVPSIAVLLSIFWLRKKREYAKSDPGGREKIKCLQEELAEALNAEAEALKGSPLSKAERSVIKSAPIDILPNGMGSQRSSPLNLTDEEVDIEIEKIIKKRSLEKEKKMMSPENQNLNEKINKENSLNITVSSLCASQAEGFCVEEMKEINHNSNNCSVDASSPEQSQLLDRNPLSGPDSISGTEEEVLKDSSVAAEMEPDPSDTIDDCSKGDSSDLKNVYPSPQRRRISERDSANHSPVDPLLASPSMCHFSDNHSEGSSDSGKGCSEAASPPPANMNPTEAGLRIYQFIIPQSLVGLLIGKHGSFVIQIKAKTGANVYVRKHPDNIKQKICAVEGTQSEIDAALDMIRDKFPEKKFPNLCLDEISTELYQKLIPLIPEFLQLQLVENVNNETIMTCLVSAGHFFLQQPLHPSFPALHALHRLMAATYARSDVPSLPRPVKEGSICAAPTENNWYRAQVISTSEENDTSVVKLVDFGGYLTVDNDQLKQIRSDFMTLPFQATEALLAFVKPANNEREWSGEALRIMAGLTAGQLLHAQVAGYDEAGLPLVHLYLTIAAQQVIFLNRELVDRGLAEWELPADS